MYQDTRTRDLRKFCRVILGQKHSSQTQWQYVNSTGAAEGTYQKVTSMRSTSRGVPDSGSSFYTRERLYHRDLVNADRELSQTDRPKKGLALKMWKLCNPHPCSMVKIEAAGTWTPKYQVSGLNGWEYSFEGNIALHSLGNFIPSVPISQYKPTTRHRDLAITKAYSLAKSPVLPIQVYLGELGETLHMLRKPLGALRDFMSPKHNTSVLRSHLDLVGGSWLEYRYGWLPLVYQINEIIDSFDERVSKGFPIRVVRAGSPRDESTTVLQRKTSVDNRLYVNSLVTTVESERASAMLATRQNVSANKFFGNRWSDLLQTAWELKTLSFVWDWIFNIGDWLGACVPDPDLKVIANSVSIKRLRHITVRPLNGRLYDTGLPHRFPAPKLVATYKEECLDRVVNLPLPNMPIYRQHLLSLARTADALSLTYGKIKDVIRHVR